MKLSFGTDFLSRKQTYIKWITETKYTFNKQLNKSIAIKSKIIQCAIKGYMVKLINTP